MRTACPKCRRKIEPHGVSCVHCGWDPTPPVTEWHVHTGRPSWHQQRAGHISAGVTVFHTSDAAERYLANYRTNHPGEPAFIVER